MSKKTIFIFIIIVTITGAFLLHETTEDPIENSTNTTSLFDVYTVSSTDLDNIHFFYKDRFGHNYSTIENLKEHIESNGENLSFATNGGIFSPEFAPLGLYIENGMEITPINTSTGQGNFFLQPNGIFFIASNTAAIVQTEKFSQKNTSLAIQSGPILLSNKTINPLFSSTSTHKYIRSGVCVTKENAVHFAISNTSISFYDFAHFLKNDLRCNDALYLDGAISEMYIAKKRGASAQKFATVIAVTE